ncbi:MAG TPA: tetratricopeptide repeat protein [Candidatus Sulfotelmatobacter sp.]|nr:tetratricopeptide repeat protein [Candidatus Sulfotelmatobacter sp.]
MILLCGALSLSGNKKGYADISGNLIRLNAAPGMAVNSRDEITNLADATASYPATGNDDHKQAPGEGKPESFEELARGAQAAMEADRVQEAIRLYIQATKLRPDWSEGWWHIGTLLFDAGHFGEARAAFADFVRTERKQPGPGFGMLGLSEFQLRHYTRALSDLERGIQLGLGTNPEFTRTVLYRDAVVNTLSHHPEIALQRLTLIANLEAAAHPDAPKDAVLSDVELLDAFGTAALQIRKLPTELPATQLPLVRKVGHAQAQVALQDRVAAEEELKQVLTTYGSDPGVHYVYGVFLLKEHPPLAVDEFRREIEISPSHDGARIQLALEFLRTADYEEGLKYAREAVALAPDNFVAHVACGRLWLALDKTDRAMPELRTAVKLAPRSPDAHFALSQALSRAGRNNEASRERAEFTRLKALSDAANR